MSRSSPSVCSPSWWVVGWHRAAMRWLDAHEDKDIPCKAFERLEARHRAAIKRLDDQSKANAEAVATASAERRNH